MVSGLCAAGGFEVDNIAWTNGKLAGATILSKVGNVCNLRSKWPIDVMLGTNYIGAPMVLPGLYQFSTVAGSNYTIVPANIAEWKIFGHDQWCDPANHHQRGFEKLARLAIQLHGGGKFCQLHVTNLNAGNYHIDIGANAATNGAQFQLSCGLTAAFSPTSV